MTKKRFVAIGVEWVDGFIQDHIGDRDLFNIGAVCNLLNELSEENEKLLNRCVTLQKSLNECIALEEENEKLKKDIENYAFISDCSVQVLDEEEDVKDDYLAICSKKLADLQEELQYYKSKCASLETGLFEADREITMLKHTISRNETYIDKLTHKGEWRTNSDEDVIGYLQAYHQGDVSNLKFSDDTD